VDHIFIAIEPELQKKERNKAREIRASQWWKNQLGRGHCYYCNCPFSPKELTMDHKVPIIRGGKSTRTNIVPCCKICNNEKKHMLLGEWIAKRQEEGLEPLACARLELY
jgi:5-methylcytosine-specific restriction endonuclease McrA